jgi:hypothetical protein
MKAISTATHQRFVLTIQDAFRSLGDEHQENLRSGIHGVQRLYDEYEYHLEMLYKVIGDYQQAHKNLRMEFRKQKTKASAARRKQDNRYSAKRLKMTGGSAKQSRLILEQIVAER